MKVADLIHFFMNEAQGRYWCMARGRKAYPGCLYLHWEFEDCFVKHLEQTNKSNHYGPLWHSHCSSP